MFILEYLDNEVAQVLSIEAVTNYWNDNLTDFLPEINNVATLRDMAGILYTTGVIRSDKNLVIIGLTLLGKIEKEHGIRAVYQEPWAPLPWSENYLQKALDELKGCSEQISQQCVDILSSCCSEDEELVTKVQATVEDLKGRGLITNEEKLTLNGICASLKEQLPRFESDHIKLLDKIASDWAKEHELLMECEKEMVTEVDEKRLEYKKQLEIEEKAHQMAVVELGFYDLEKKESDQSAQDLEFYLRDNYVKGSFEELEIVERLRQKTNSVKNPLLTASLSQQLG